MPIGDAALAKDYISMIDKLIITGGQNVLPKFYGEEITIDSDDYLLKRDLFELALIEEARAAKKAIFTVCRGTQLYNVALGELCIKTLNTTGRTIQVSTPAKSW